MGPGGFPLCIGLRATVGFCVGFSDAEMLGSPHALPVGVGEAPRHEVAGGWRWRCNALYGD
jgi:hypothetical protein